MFSWRNIRLPLLPLQYGTRAEGSWQSLTTLSSCFGTCPRAMTARELVTWQSKAIRIKISRLQMYFVKLIRFKFALLRTPCLSRFLVVRQLHLTIQPLKLKTSLRGVENCWYWLCSSALPYCNFLKSSSPLPSAFLLFHPISITWDNTFRNHTKSQIRNTFLPLPLKIPDELFSSHWDLQIISRLVNTRTTCFDFHFRPPAENSITIHKE